MSEPASAPPIPIHRLLGGMALGLAFVAAGLLIVIGPRVSVEGAELIKGGAAAWIGGLGLTSILLIRTDSERLLWAVRVFALGLALPAGLAALLLRAALQQTPATPLLFVLATSAVAWLGASFVLRRIDPAGADEAPRP